VSDQVSHPHKTTGKIIVLYILRWGEVKCFPYCINLQAPCILYIGQTYCYAPEYTFYIFSQQIHLIIFFRLSVTIFVYSSTKCRVFPNVILLGS
jgi:hypothetical protein